jgi:hypothetical protein
MLDHVLYQMQIDAPVAMDEPIAERDDPGPYPIQVDDPRLALRHDGANRCGSMFGGCSVPPN